LVNRPLSTVDSSLPSIVKFHSPMEIKIEFYHNLLWTVDRRLLTKYIFPYY